MRLIKNSRPDIILSERDYRWLANYLAEHESGLSGSALEEEIERAEIVPTRKLPAEAVALGSKVRFRDLNSGIERGIKIVEPERANLERGHVSALAPVGAALLGLRAGQEIDWQMPNGESRKFQVLEVENRFRAGPAPEGLRAA
jgi:regulator of nucleoside diphosphate kinase